MIGADIRETTPAEPERALNALLAEAPDKDAERIAAELERSGLRPVYSRAGTRAEFAAALRRDLSMILCGRLPDLDPRTALALLNETGLAIPLIVVGGSSEAEVAVECMRRGASDYLREDRLDGLAPAVLRALAERKRTDAERRAATELRERAERFRLLVEQLPAAVYMRRAGADGETYYVSPAIESVLGYSVDQWLADPALWAERLHTNDRKRAVAQELYSRTSGEDLRAEYRIYARDGRLVWVRDEATMVRRGDGTLDHLEGLMIDVTAEKEAQRGLLRARMETMLRLARAAEFREDEVVAHVSRVSRYCRLIATRLGLGADRCERVGLASRLHDVGKVGVPEAVLDNPGPLNAEERAAIEEHPTVGYRILTGSGVEVLELAAVIAWTHHEHFDGGGYPRGLVGDAIPLEGRITAVADGFDELTSIRRDRDPYPYAEAAATMRTEGGSRFDPAVLDAFLSAEPEIAEIMGSASDLQA